MAQRLISKCRMRHSSCDTEMYSASTFSLVHSRSEPTGTTTATKSFLLLPHPMIAARYASRTSLAYNGRSLPTVNVCPLLVQIWENPRRGLTQAGSASACGSFMIQVLIVMERSGLFDLSMHRFVRLWRIESFPSFLCVS